jgi:hypothetical protein
MCVQAGQSIHVNNNNNNNNNKFLYFNWNFVLITKYSY